MNKVDQETADREFERFATAMDLEIDTSKMDEEDRKGFEQQRGRVIKAIMTGSLVINEDGEPVFTPSFEGNALTFYEPTGGTYMAMDRKKNSENMARMATVMAEMTKTSPKTFANMKNRDFKVCLAITLLFMG